MSKRKRKVSTGVYQNSYDSKDKGGTGRTGIIDWKAFKKEIKHFKVEKEGKYYMNIIPYEIKSKKHPLVAQKRCGIGDLAFDLDIFVHQYIGPNQVDVICPKKNYRKPCPICDLVSEYYDKGKKKEAKDLQASRRGYFNVQIIKDGEAEELKVWHISHFKFTKELIEEANECADGKGPIAFADIEDGKVISFRARENPDFKNAFDFKSWRFKNRDEELEDGLIDEAISFDEHLIIMPPEEIEKVLYGASEDEDNDEKDTKKASKDDDDDEDEPVKEKKQSKKDDNDEEKETKSDKNKCPYGHKFGTDCDDKDECDKCKSWDNCMNELETKK